MRTANDNFVKALLCLTRKSSPTEVRVLMCWMMNKDGYPSTHVQIANELDISDKQVSKAFRKLKGRNILENISNSKNRPIYKITDKAIDYFYEWLNRQEQLKLATLSCLNGQLQVVQADNHTNKTNRTNNDFSFNEISKDNDDFYNNFKLIGELK